MASLTNNAQVATTTRELQTAMAQFRATLKRNHNTMSVYQQTMSLMRHNELEMMIRTLGVEFSAIQKRVLAAQPTLPTATAMQMRKRWQRLASKCQRQHRQLCRLQDDDSHNKQILARSVGWAVALTSAAVALSYVFSE